MFTFFKFHKIQSNNKLVTLIFLGWSWKNVFEACLYPTSSCQCMSVIAPKSNLSLFMFSLSQVLSLSIAWKLRSHSAEVIENVHVITNRTNMLRKSFHCISYLLLPMYLTDRWKLLSTTCAAKVEILDLHHLYLSNLFHTLPESGKYQHFSLNFSEHKTDGVKINNFAVLQLNY